jgi:hypothetical protein
MATQGYYFLGAVVVVVLVVGGISMFAIPQAPSSGSTTTFQNPGESGSVDGLVLGASLNASVVAPGAPIALRIYEMNSLDSVVNVSASNSWPYANLKLGPCGSLSTPFGFKVLEGYYAPSSAGLSSAEGVPLYSAGVYGCPSEFQVSSYSFLPMSTEASLGGFCSSGPCETIPMNGSEILSGWYSGTQLMDFAPGVYTVVVGDEWGASLVLYFEVSQTGGQGTIILPAGTSLTVSSSFDCVAGNFQLQFNAPSQSLLTGAFVSQGPGVTLYVATQMQAASVFQGHPSDWVYSTGATNSTDFSFHLTGGSYVVWIEGADMNCGATVVTPLEMLTQVNVTQAFVLEPS